MIRCAAWSVVVACECAAAAGEPGIQERHWPQFRGPTGNGVAPAADPPVTWGEGRNVVWKARIPGRGAATPIVWENKIFIQTAIATDRKGAPAKAGGGVAGPTEVPEGMAGMIAEQPDTFHQFVLICLDRRSGAVLWQKVACEAVPHERHHREHGYASHSPVTDGTHVLAFFGSRGLHCYDMEGNLTWRKDLGLMRTRMTFGEGSSPAVSGGTAVINWDHEGDDFILALDIQSGRELWRKPRDEVTSWSTPLIYSHQGAPQVIVSATGRIRGYDLSNGNVIWECGGMTPNVIPTPVAADGMVYAMSGFRGNALLAIRLGRGGNLTRTDAIAWSLRKHTPYVPSPLLYGGRLYFFSGNTGVLSCHEAKTGRPLFSARRIEDLEGVYASPVGAGGRAYLVGRNGVTVVIKCGDTWEALATNRLNERIDASPAAAGKDLFLRGREHVYRIGSDATR